MWNLFTLAGCECTTFDIVNGTQFGLADDSVWDALLYSVAAREYVGAFASPDCSAFPRLHDPAKGPSATPWFVGLRKVWVKDAEGARNPARRKGPTA